MKEFRQLKEQQLRTIKDAIIEFKPEDSKFFKVFSTEAGLGKTRATEEALVELWIKNPSIKTLFVKQFKDKNYSEPSAKRINELVKKEGFNEIIAEAYDGDTKSEWIEEDSNKEVIYKKFNDLISRPILIVTHKLYENICEILSKPDFMMDYIDRSLFDRYKAFFEDRTNLIIDEELDLLDGKEISVGQMDLLISFIKKYEIRYYSESKNLIENEEINLKPFTSKDSFLVSDYIDKIISALTLFAAKVKNEQKRNKDRIPLIIDFTMIQFLTDLYLGKSISKLRWRTMDIIFQQLKSVKNQIPYEKDADKKIQKEVYKHFIEDIYEIASNFFDLCERLFKPYDSAGQVGDILKFDFGYIIMSNMKYYFNRRWPGHLLAKNNIILDATAKLSYFYSLRPEIFKIIKQDIIQDYSNTTIHGKKLNTTSTAKKIELNMMLLLVR